MNTRGLGSQLKDSIPVTELSASGPFESHDILRKGVSCVKNELLPSHPLELSEKNFQLNQDKMNFSTLRNIQGLFAPLKLQMEFKAVQQRIPFTWILSIVDTFNLSLHVIPPNLSLHVIPPNLSLHVIPPNLSLHVIPPNLSLHFIPPNLSLHVIPPNLSLHFIPPNLSLHFIPPNLSLHFIPPNLSLHVIPPNLSLHVIPPNLSLHVIPPNLSLHVIPPNLSLHVIPPNLSLHVIPPNLSLHFIPPNLSLHFIPPNLSLHFIPPNLSLHVIPPNLHLVPLSSNIYIHSNLFSRNRSISLGYLTQHLIATPTPTIQCTIRSSHHTAASALTSTVLHLLPSNPVQRLPFLPSSNLSLDILRGNDETVGFEDILNDPSQSELMGEPHLMVEYKLGLM
ncbi:hypothetical protein MC885_001666 [Smutsia gigantea]|nr:hypothetical protein MC885_001666 [Smutsia gigantea]